MSYEAFKCTPIRDASTPQTNKFSLFYIKLRNNVDMSWRSTIKHGTLQISFQREQKCAC